MIVVTGAAGFIGSYLVSFLNKRAHNDLVIVDDFSSEEKQRNLQGKKFTRKVDRDKFLEWFSEHSSEVEFVFHIGARTDTTEFDKAVFDKLNVSYTKEIWKICQDEEIGLVYASSAATYGLGEHGYVDSHKIVQKLKPLNPYGVSKNEFDKWALQQESKPPFWCGLKFFNVYGPNEYHKGRMASVIFHAFNQIKQSGGMKLFKSHNPDFKDGEQKRDFIYVKDLVNVCYWMMKNQPESGLYNLGSGQARTFLDLVHSTFEAMGKKPDISFIPTPEDIRDKYQYFTEADMSKLKRAGYDVPFTSLEDGVSDYVKHYLSEKKYF